MSSLMEQLRDTKDELYNQAADRIEVLELALREIKDCYLSPEQSSAIARAALAPSMTND